MTTKRPLSDLPAEPPAQSLAAPAWSMPTSPPAPRDSLVRADTVRKTLLGFALALLGVSVIVAYYSANAIVSIWFERQWVPVARLVLALAVAGAAAWALVRLTRKPA